MGYSDFYLTYQKKSLKAIDDKCKLQDARVYLGLRLKGGGKSRKTYLWLVGNGGMGYNYN